MKILARTLLTIGLVSLSPLAYGNETGGSISGGGGSVLCRGGDGAITSAQLLDFFEADAKGWDLKRDLGDAALDPFAKVRLALDRFAGTDAYLAGLLRKELAAFEASNALVNGALPGIPDADPDVLPGPGCEIVQAAAQRPPRVPADKYFMIAKTIWTAMSNDDRAGLVLHEILYKYAKDRFNPQNSVAVRYLNVLITSTNGFVGKSAKDYLKLLSDIGMPDSAFVVHGFELGGELEFHPNGAVAGGRLNSKTAVKLRPTDAMEAVIDSGYLSFHPGGEIETFSLAEAADLDLNGQMTTWPRGGYTLAPNGVVRRASAFDNISYALFGNSGAFEWANFGDDGHTTDIAFVPSGHAEIAVGNGTFSLDGKSELHFNGYGVAAFKGGPVRVKHDAGQFEADSAEFKHPSGRPSHAEKVGFYSFEVGGCETEVYQPRTYASAWFHENGQIGISYGDRLWGPSPPVEVCIQGHKLSFVADFRYPDVYWNLWFYDTGIPKDLFTTLDEETSLQCADGTKRTFRMHAQVSFNADGTAICP